MEALSLLQGALVAALRADAALVAIIGSESVFDAPPKGRAAPWVVIARHDALARDGDLAPGLEHRLLIHCWSDQPSRKRALDMAGRVVAVAASFVATDIAVTHRDHLRTETAVDGKTGQARAAVSLRFHSEPI